MNLANKHIAVLGLGLEGKDLLKFLLKQKGVSITVFDQKTEDQIDFSGLNKSKFKLICGSNYLSSGLDNFDIVFRSPGVYRFLPELKSAEKKGVKISSAINLFFELCPAKIVGVTGTKGKGTTSTLIYRILEKSGKKVYLAGNIGKPYLELLKKLDKNSWVVLEMSSFQLIDLKRSPHIAVVLNITQDHLDWHKSVKEYIEAKQNIVKNQKKNDYAVVNWDYPVSRTFASLSGGKAFFFSRKKVVEGSYVEDGYIYLSVGGKKQLIGSVEKLKLLGEHNWENVAAAVCASRLAGANLEAIKKVVFSFTGLEHRLERVKTIAGVTFYNDSFSTNPGPTIAAVRSFKVPMTLILGGYDKGLDYGDMAKEISESSNVGSVVLIGQTRLKIKRELKKRGFRGKMLDLGFAKMGKIVKVAFENTPSGGVVILSPASASFDMFKDYKDRGNIFKREVLNLGHKGELGVKT